MSKKTLRDIEVKGKRVLVRVDFNVPMKDGQILDFTRIEEALPTIRYLIEQRSKIILVTHLGRPKGRVDSKYSVQPFVQHLRSLLFKEVFFASDCGGEESKKIASKMEPGQVLLLENVRFYPEEEKNDPDFARALAELADVYVDDAFGNAHRKHASTVQVAEYLPAVAGFLMEKEIKALEEATKAPEKPFTLILGGAKVEDKIPVVKNVIDKVDYILVGGVMANTFLKAQGYNLGKTLVEDESLDIAKSILKESAEQGVEVVLPIDMVVADQFSAFAQAQTVSIQEIPREWMALDIGPATIQAYVQIIRESKTVVWNGPLGVYELDKFAVGTIQIAKALADTETKAFIGGGDVVAAVEKAGVTEKMYHISTGGGASLEFLAGKKLPGIAALQDK